jgi:hypothetical protein
MDSLFDLTKFEELKNRLQQLAPGTAAQWGRMSASQMLAHCATCMDTASGVTSPSPRNWLSYLFGPFAKRRVLSDRPLGRNMPTDRAFVVTGERDFVAERERLLRVMERFAGGGAEGCTTEPHSFFGLMTPDEWARLSYKHLDHHFRQFGV